MTDTSTNGQAPVDAPTEFSEGFHADAAKLVRRYPVARSALLPLLHLVQSEHNYVSEAGIAFCARTLDLTKAEVAAVATFYTMYKREPVGDYLLSVCTNPTCQVAGSQVIFDRYRDELGGTNDPETKVSIEEAECLGICDAAPVVQVNYDMYGPLTDEEADRLLAGCRKGEPPASTWSGEPAPTFSEVERELSGANDGFSDALVEAARHSITGYDVAPAYKSGETDIPVTHPGGDRSGHGGEIFAAQFAGAGADDQPDQDEVQDTDAADVAAAADDAADDSDHPEAHDVADAADAAAATGGDDGEPATAQSGSGHDDADDTPADDVDADGASAQDIASDGAPSDDGGSDAGETGGDDPDEPGDDDGGPELVDRDTDATDATDVASSVDPGRPPVDASTLPTQADPAGVIPDHPLEADDPAVADGEES